MKLYETGHFNLCNNFDPAVGKQTVKVSFVHIVFVARSDTFYNDYRIKYAGYFSIV